MHAPEANGNAVSSLASNLIEKLQHLLENGGDIDLPTLEAMLLKQATLSKLDIVSWLFFKDFEHSIDKTDRKG